MNAAQLERLRFIDVLIDHCGGINRGTIMDYFGLSQPQASLDLRAYLAQAPGNIEYDRQLRSYRRTATYQRKFP